MSEKCVYIKCDCGCAIIQVTKYEEPENDILEYYFTTYEVSGRSNKWAIFKWRLRAAWKMIRYGDVYKDHLCINRDEMKELVDKLSIL